MNTEALATLLDGMPFLLLTPQEKSIIVHQQLSPQMQKEKKGDNCLPAIWGWEVIQPTGKTQVFNDAKRCLILPSFSPGEWYFQPLDFSPPHCTIPEERNIFWAKKKLWNIEVKIFAVNSVSNITMLKDRIRLHMVQGAGGCLKVIPFHHISQADLNS